jgi:parvulin-like peptidyl-prolyl isomerase
MLESLRTNKRNLVISFLFLIIIAVFILNFGPQSGSGSCSGASKDFVLSVNDGAVSESSWRYAVNTLQRRGSQQRELAMDLLLRREILAQAAEDAGFRIGDDAVNEVVKSGAFYILGDRQTEGKGFYRYYFTDGFFDYKLLDRAARGWGLSIEQFRDQQRRELLAAAWAHAIESSALASRDEALAAFELDQTQAELDVVRFRPGQYASALELTDADLDAYIAANEAKVKAQYDADFERDYKERKAEAKVRKIFVPKTPKPAADPATPDGAGATPTPTPTPAPVPAPADGAAAAAPPVPPPADEKPELDPAYQTVAAARADIVAGKKTFADVAKAISEDASKSKGGLIGWRKLEAPTLGATEANDALKTLEEGKVSDVIVGKTGFYLLVVEGKREGELTFDQVKREIADKMAREYYADENARRDALATLAKAREGTGKKLEDMFAREEKPKNDMDPQQFQEMIQTLQDAGWSEDQIRQYIQQFLQQQMGQQSGALEWESEDIPAAWTEAPPAADALKLPEAGAPPAPAPPAPAPVEDVMRVATDVIPKPATPVEAKVLRVGPFRRDRETIDGLGKAPELMRAVFDELGVGDLAPKIYKIGPEYVVAQLVDRTQADLAEFTKLETERIADLAELRGKQALGEWVIARCEKLAASKAISPNLGLLQENDENGKPLPVTYKPCEHLQPSR